MNVPPTQSVDASSSGGTFSKNMRARKDTQIGGLPTRPSAKVTEMDECRGGEVELTWSNKVEYVWGAHWRRSVLACSNKHLK